MSPFAPRRILIVRPSALGDACRTVPAVRTLRRAWPDAEIDILLQDVCLDAFRHDPDISDVVSFPRSRLRGLAGLVRVPGVVAALRRRLRARNYDLVFDLQGLARSGLLTWATGAPRRVGFANAREFGWLGYNRGHVVDRGLHHVDRLLELLRREGLEPVHDVTLHVGGDDLEWVDQVLGAGAARAPRHACLAPTSRWLCKAWPLDRFTEIGRRLLADGRIDSLVILCGPGERAYAAPMLEALVEAAGGPGRVIMPETTVGRFLALVSRASLLVCNDSAPLHAGVGFHRPIVAIFGPTDPALVGPYRRPECVVRPAGTAGLGSIGFYRRQKDDQSLISEVPLEAVWQRVCDELGTGPAGRDTAPAGAKDFGNPGVSGLG